MSIILRDSYFSDKEKENINENESLEFALSLIRKLGFDNYKIFKIEKEKTSPFYALRKITSNGFSSTIINIEGEMLFNEKSTNINIVEIPNIQELYRISDNNLINKYDKLLSDFNNISFTKKAQDKNGDEYTFEYISNCRLGNVGEGSEDILSVSNFNNDCIGYLKVIYTKEEDYKILNPTIIHEVLSLHNNNYDISISSTKKELIEAVYDHYKWIGDIEENSIESEYNRIVESFKIKYSKQLNDIDFNLATTMYVSINNEDDSETGISYRGKGLAQLMYFEVAKELNKKGLKFRSSTTQLEDGLIIWNNLNFNLKNNINEIDFDNVKVYELNVSEFENLSFVDGKLNHTSINSFLENKSKKPNFKSPNIIGYNR
jgi:hypothetical protein